MYLKGVLATIGLIAVDQISKIFMLSNYPDLIFYNRGIAFSLPFHLNFTVVLTLAVMILVAISIYKKLIPLNWVWVMFLGGGLGNLIDRVRIQAVIDFINLGFFPVFNFADVFITISALGIIYYHFIKQDYDRK
jgi:signal peptidase II